MSLFRSTFARPAVYNQFNKLAFFSSAADTSHLVLNALGPDRLGIVSDLTQKITHVGGSVGESQATKLGSYFSLTMILSVPTAEVDAFKSSLKELQGVETQCIEAEGDPSKSDAAVCRPARVAYSGKFRLSGADHPGLVNSVTSALAKHGLSIDTMETGEETAAYGQTLFSAEGIATASEPLSNSFDTNKIRKELEALGDSLNCDITLEDNVARKSRLSTTVWVNMA